MSPGVTSCWCAEFQCARSSGELPNSSKITLNKVGSAASALSLLESGPGAFCVPCGASQVLLAVLSALWVPAWQSLAMGMGTLWRLQHWSLRMQVTLWSCREGGCSPAPPSCWDSCVHLRLPSFPIYQRELREQDKCSHSVSVSASFPGPGDFLSLDFVLVEEV